MYRIGLTSEVTIRNGKLAYLAITFTYTGPSPAFDFAWISKSGSVCEPPSILRPSPEIHGQVSHLLLSAAVGFVFGRPAGSDQSTRLIF